MLRHTFATQLVNAGCRITTIQALLGHCHLNTTLTYACVHDHTVAADYLAAMALVEAQLQLPLLRSPEPMTAPHDANPNGFADGAHHLLTLVEALAAETLAEDQRALVAELRQGLLALTP